MKISPSVWGILSDGAETRTAKPLFIYVVQLHICWFRGQACLFFVETSKEKLENSERAPLLSWHPWTLVYSRDRPYNFSCLSAMSKNDIAKIGKNVVRIAISRRSPEQEPPVVVEPRRLPMTTNVYVSTETAFRQDECKHFQWR